MTCRSPRTVILAKRERAPFAAHYESLPIGPGYGSDEGLLTVTLLRGNGREPEGIAAPPPGISAERAWSKD